ncbi:hypothetical protein AB0C52_05275 [Streptomyces sp. NPDC048717]|uniref:hypothetical protein n=1 Tax=Streptomyces sp. NPDC048717 TaxID=3154928 RepID=UPI00341D5BB6
MSVEYVCGPRRAARRFTGAPMAPSVVVRHPALVNRGGGVRAGTRAGVRAGVRWQSGEGDDWPAPQAAVALRAG